MPAPGTFRLRRTTTWVRLAPNESQENIMGKADMFTFDETPVKFIGLLVLLSWCTIWCLYELTGSRGARQRVCDVLHLVMAVVMLAMVPKGVWMALTGVVAVPMIVAVFAAATLWFAWLTFGTLGQSRRHGGAHRGHGLHHAGHTAMFAAMTWHLAAMAVKASARGRLGTGPQMHHWMEQAKQPGSILWIFALVGLPFMTYLAIASILALWRALRPGTPDDPRGSARRAGDTDGCHKARRDDAAGTTRHRLASLCDFAMNFGMFWMSTGLLTPILPFFAALAF